MEGLKAMSDPRFLVATGKTTGAPEGLEKGSGNDSVETPRKRERGG